MAVSQPHRLLPLAKRQLRIPSRGRVCQGARPAVAAVTQCHELGGCAVSQVWRQKVQNEGVTRLVPRGSEGKRVPGLSPGTWWLPAILGVPWLTGVSPQPLPPSSRPLLLCVLISPSCKGLSLDLRLIPVQANLISRS